MSNYTIAAFDFDNTITTRDTLFDFLKKSFGKKKYFSEILVLFPILVLNRLRIFSDGTTKQKLISSFLKDVDNRLFQQFCLSYVEEINKITNIDALAKILWHKSNGHKVVIVSASIEDWIIPWAIKMNIDSVIATKLEKRNRFLTGQFESKNCKGLEKVKRLLELFPNRNEYDLFVYGDSEGDKELLELADFKFFKTF
jgi:phosphatidylglycerophosphatase C